MPRASGSHVSPAALAFAQAPRAEHTPARPADAAAGVAPVEVSKVRALLAHDRRDAGEQRPEVAPIGPLPTASYTIPLGVQIRRLGRGRLRAALALSAALMASVLGLGALARRDLREARAAEPKAAAALASAIVPEAPTERAAPPAASSVDLAPAEDAAAELRPASAGVGQAELHHRFVRADALLRHPSARAAREARALLESALPHAPRDAHGYAALATACHRLGDARCADDAISRALTLRPKRSRYVALGHLIRADLAARR